MQIKTIIIDDEKAYISSINYPRQNMDENHELGIVFNESAIVRSFPITVENYWSIAQSLQGSKLLGVLKR